MKVVWAIASLTFKEAIRNKILYLLLCFSIVLTAFSWIIGQLTIGDELKIINDVSLGSIHFFGVLITILIGIGLVFREMEKRTVYLVLSKPVDRYQFLLGKYVGLAVTLFCILAVLGTVFYGILLLKHAASSRFLIVFYTTYLEWLLIAAVALLFSSFSTPLLSTMLTLAIFFAGHLTQSLLLLERRITSEAANLVLSALYYVLPNLEVFNVRAKVVNELPIAAHYLMETTAYWSFYCGVLILSAIVIFQKKDFV